MKSAETPAQHAAYNLQHLAEATYEEARYYAGARPGTAYYSIHMLRAKVAQEDAARHSKAAREILGIE